LYLKILYFKGLLNQTNMTKIANFLSFILICILLLACSQKENTEGNSDPLPRIAIAGIAIESSTFSPAVSEMDAFRVSRGEEVFNLYPFFSADSVNRNRASWFPALYARAIPGGAVTRETYEALVNEILERLKENLPYDGMFFDIHGAMSVTGLDDPEGDLITRIREVIGDETIISTSMDLHGSVTWRLAENTDLITCYRLAPHDDAMESKKRTVDNLLERLELGQGKPKYKAWVAVPIVVAGRKRQVPGWNRPKAFTKRVAPLSRQ
jgi:microcystin degradation protein MlrC